jgi:PAS domain S-box-containing protein
MVRILRTDIHLTDRMVLLGILLGIAYQLVDMMAMVLTDRTGGPLIRVLFGEGWHAFYHHIAIFCAFVVFGIYAQISVNKDKDVERALREDGKRLRVLTEATFDGIVISERGSILELNDNFALMFGYKPIELVGRQFQDLLALESRHPFEYNSQRAREEPFNAIGLKKDGSVQDVEIISRDVQYNGRPAQIAAIRNISERRLSERRIARTIELSDIVLNIATRFVIKSDLDSAIELSLGEVSTFNGASHACIFQFREGGPLMDCTHEWCADGTTPERVHLQGMATSTYDWWLDRFRRSRDEASLEAPPRPPDGGPDPVGLGRGGGPVSQVGMPIFRKGTLAGFIEFDSIMSKGVSDEDDIILRQIFSELLEAALERRKVMEDIQQSEERFRTLVSTAPDGILLSDAKGTIIEVNGAFERLIGYDRDEIVGRNYMDLHSNAKVHARGTEVFQMVMAGGPLVPQELEILAKDGRRVPVEVAMTPLKDSDGRVVGIIAMVRDISERRRAAEELREAEERFRVLANATMEGIVIHDAGKILEANDTLPRMLGYGPEIIKENIGRSFLRFVAKEGHETVVRNILSGHDTPYEIELVKADGTRLPVEVGGKEIPYKGATVRVSSVRDISARRRSEEAMRRRLELERVVSRTSSRFVGLGSFDDAVMRSLEDLGTFAGASHAYVFQFRADGGAMDRTHEWCAQGATPRKDGLQGLPSDTLPLWMGLLLAGQTIHVGDVSAMPPEARVEKGMLEARGIGSIIVLPFQVSGALAGFIGLDDVEGTAGWSGADIELLDVFSKLLGKDLERRRVDRALVESEELYRLLANNVSDVIWTMGTDMRLTYISPSVLGAMGYASEEMTGRSFEDILTPASLAIALEAWGKALGDGGDGAGPPGAASIELEHVRKDGTVIWVENRVSVMRDDRGRATGVVGVSRDITARRRMEDALRESEERFRRLTELSFDGFVITDRSKILYMSDNLARKFGYGPDEVKDRSTLDLVVPEDRDRVMRAILSKEEHPYEVRGMRRDGSTIDMEIIGGDIRYSGQVARIAAVRDISERKTAERRQTEERNRAELYIDIFGHDINNLNQGIVMPMDLLQRMEGLPEASRRLIESVRRQSMAISRIVLRVQELSRLRDASLSPSTVDIASIVADAADQVRRSHPDREVRVTIGPADGEVLVQGHDLLLNAFLNIIENAVKYDEHEPVVIDVTARVSEDGSRWRVGIADRGPGIPDGMKRSIFNRDDRAAGAYRRSGLGLLIVSEISKGLGGAVWVEDRVEGDPSQGSVFVVELSRA